MAEQLWSMSTTVREAERIIGFLKTAQELEGQAWTNENQEKFQILLIKNRLYLCDPDNSQIYNNLNNKQCELLKNKEIKMSFSQAEDIFYSKDYREPPMRGRQSMSPLVKLGLVFMVPKDDNSRVKYITISSVGKKLCNNEISFEDFMLDCLLKYQYPNPLESSYRDWNTKPFINTLRLIKRVNELCEENNMSAKGITKTEFGIFCLSMKSFQDVDSVAKTIIEFRKNLISIPNDQQENFINNFTKEYLKNFVSPEHNIKEYTDNMIRYIRLTKYIYIRGKYNNTYIDLEPRRMTEINSILETDNGSAKNYSRDQWIDYMGTYNSYIKPFETPEKLITIQNEITQEIYELEMQLGIKHKTINIPLNDLKEEIEKLRNYRTELQNLVLKQEYHQHTEKINEAVNSLNDIITHNRANLAKKYSIELEKWTNVALNIINDAEEIHPNAPVGDDNEPIYTAPSGVADIECIYNNFVSICEVTTLTNRDQWFNEGQPVMRHLRNYENSHLDKPGYCLFVAPSIHVDTINTFFMAVKYEYEGKSQKIIPITISQMIKILEIIKELLDKGKKFSHLSLKGFYDSCLDISSLSGSNEWKSHIVKCLDTWAKQISA